MTPDDTSKKIAVLYHGPACADGFGAAFAAWTKLGDQANYLPINYGDPLPTLAQYDTLYIVDFSFPRETMIELAYDHQIICLDHHKTAEAALEDLELPEDAYVHFDMSRSGAVLAWEYFHPNEAVPQLLLYVQDRDLWTWKLPHSEEVSAGLSIVPRTFEAWDQLARDEGHITTLASQGSAVLAYQKQVVQSLAAKATLTWIAGHHVPTVNSPILQSEIGNTLLELHPDAAFAAVYYSRETEEIYSLRSSGFDVSEVAKAYGGGGHKQAAGFNVSKLRSPIL